jgi:uncharacterized protein YukE
MNPQTSVITPVPGDPEEARRISALFATVEGRAQEIASRLRSIESGVGPQMWAGQAADGFTALLAETGPDLVTLATSYGRASQALATYATELAAAQDTARAAQDEASTATEARDRASTDQAAARSDADQHAAAAADARTRLDEVGAQDAERRRDDAVGRENAARAIVDQAEQARRAAQQKADEAAAQRDAAAARCIRELEDASRAGIETRNLAQPATAAGPLQAVTAGANPTGLRIVGTGTVVDKAAADRIGAGPVLAGALAGAALAGRVLAGATLAGAARGVLGPGLIPPPPAGPAPTVPGDGKPLRRDEMDRIRREYQVSDDPDGRREWEPGGFTGWLAETFGGDPDPVRVTASEARLLDDLGPFGLQALVSARDDARAEANNRFPSQAPPPEGNDDHNDAFRHAYWNALMTRNIGEDFAHDYGYAHERVPLNPPNREAMDLYNNTVGQRIAADNPFASEEELADLVESAIRNGEMVVLDREGNLVPSNQVQPDQTGHEPDDAPALPGNDPEWRTES